MNKEYKIDKEYSVAEIIRYNVRMWWLAAIFALVCAAVLGGYKYKSNHQFVERELYDNIQQVTAGLYVRTYSDETSVERVGTIVKIAVSNRTYEKLVENTGCNLSYAGYQALFTAMQGDVSDVASIYVNYPATYDEFSLPDEEAAKRFASEVIKAIDEVSKEMIGEQAISILDEPYASTKIQKIESYAITEEEFWQGNLKAAIAGLILGVIVEVVVYTFWMLLYKKPKNAEEIRACMEVPVIDVLKESEDNEEAYKKVALFLRGENDPAKEHSCMKINCITLQCPKRDTASKVAMSYANEQKKTLFIDLAAGENGSEGANSISSYILGEGEMPTPTALNQYLDMVCRSATDEKGLNIAMNERFAAYVEEKSREYDCIIVNSADVTKSADAYAAAKLCDRNFIVCGRKTVKNENLYRAKNTVDVYNIQVDGILIYEL